MPAVPPTPGDVLPSLACARGGPGWLSAGPGAGLDLTRPVSPAEVWCPRPSAWLMHAPAPSTPAALGPSCCQPGQALEVQVRVRVWLRHLPSCVPRRGHAQAVMGPVLRPQAGWGRGGSGEATRGQHCGAVLRSRAGHPQCRRLLTLRGAGPASRSSPPPSQMGTEWCPSREGLLSAFPADCAGHPGPPCCASLPATAQPPQRS